MNLKISNIMEEIKKTMLKVDAKICDTLKPNVKVMAYFKTPSKCARVVVFADASFIHIETDHGKWNFWEKFIQKYQSSTHKVNIIDEITDKNNRVIRLFNLVAI